MGCELAVDTTVAEGEHERGFVAVRVCVRLVFGTAAHADTAEGSVDAKSSG